MRLQRRTLLAVAVLGAAAFECDPVIPIAPYTLTECPALSLAYECQSCLQNSCSGQLGAVNGACSQYLNCACPAGADVTTCAQPAECKTAFAEVPCAACDHACGLAGPGDDGGTIPADAGAGAGHADAGAGADADEPATLFCSGSFPGGTFCYAYEDLTTAEWSKTEALCTSSLQGTVGAPCSADGLLGCCALATAGVQLQSCFYATDGGALASGFQSACVSSDAGQGTWSTTYSPSR
jgi:hypothetical protein